MFWLLRLHTTSDEDDPNIKVVYFDEAEIPRVVTFLLQAILIMFSLVPKSGVNTISLSMAFKTTKQL